MQQNRQTDPGSMENAHRHMNVEIGIEAPAIPFLGIFVSNFRFCVFAVWCVYESVRAVHDGSEEFVS
jgi:hypothetical protein